MTHRRKSNVREDLVLGNNSIGTTNSTNKISNHSTFHADDSRDNEGISRSSRSTSHGWLGGSNNTTLMAPSNRGSRASSDAFLQPMSLEDDEEATNEKTATKETKSSSHFKPTSASSHSNHKNRHGTKEKEKEKRKEKHRDTEKRGKEKETSVSTVPEEEHKPKKNKHKRSSPSSSTSTSSTSLVDEPTSKSSEKEKEKDKEKERERIHFRITPHAQRPTVVAPPPSTSTVTSSSAPSVSTGSRNDEEPSRFSSSRARRNNPSNALRSTSTESTTTQNRSSRTTTPMVLPPPVHHVANRTTSNPPTAAARVRQAVNIISPMRPTQRNTSPPAAAAPDPDDDEDFQPDFGEANDSDEWEDNGRYQEEDDDDDDDEYGEYSYMDAAGFDPRHFDTEIDMEDEDIPISSMAPSSVPYTVESSSEDDDDDDDEEEEDDGQPKKKKKSSDEETVTQRPLRSAPTATRTQAAAASRFGRNRNQHQHQQFPSQPDEWNGFTRRTRPRPQAVPAGIPFTVGPAPLPLHGLGLGRGASYHPPLPVSFSRLFGGRPPFEEDTDDEDRDLTGSGESLASSGDNQVDRDAALARQLQMEEARSRGFMYIQPPPLPQPRWRNNRQWGALVNDDDDMPLPPPIMFGTDGVLARLSNMFHRRHNHNHNHPPPGNQSLATNPLLRLSLMTRELTENDYELLLSLDEPINKGAKKSQISTLPTREVTDGEEVKSCCICLADMEPKSTVKTLPCNHYFHAECIDHWLQVNKVCPIDKKSIDGDENDADSKTKKSS